MIKKFTFLVLCFLTSSAIYCQENETKISCKVINAATKEPVVYATVMLKNINRGTHADFNGNFEIPIKYYQKGTIRISSIGYNSKEVKLSELHLNTLNTIYLKSSNDELDEIVINTKKKKKEKLHGQQIVKKAIENILNNYPTQAHSYIGYYRDYQQPADDSYQNLMKSEKNIEYLNVHEAILESFDNGFTTDKLKDKKNQTLVYNYGVNKNFIQDNYLTIPYDNKSKKYSESVYISPLGGNELNILDLTNAIRNYDKMSFSFANVFKNDFVKNHYIFLKEIIYTDNIPLYKIYFYSKKDRTSFEYKAKGHIYISKKNFAIHKLNYNLFYRKNAKPQYSVTIDYREKNNKMYLNYISFNNFFEATNGNYFKIIKTTFNTKSNTFKISFNREIDPKTLIPFHKKFKIYYKEDKLKVTYVTLLENQKNTIIVAIDKQSIEKINFKNESKNPNYATFFTFDITKIKDITGSEIDKRPSIKLNQYRELFVQEVFENKQLPLQKNFVDKNIPLSKSKITEANFKDAYWINSPLKKTKE